MRIFGHNAVCICQLYLGKQLHGTAPGVLSAEPAVAVVQHISHNAAYGKYRVKAAHWILKDHGDFPAAYIALHLLLL